MKNVKLLFSLFFLFISNSILGQTYSDRIVDSGRKYFYKDKFYKKSELYNVLINDDAAYDKYLEYERIKAVSDLSGYTTLVLVGGGFLFLTISDGDFSDHYVIGVGALVGTMILGPVALFTLGISNKQLKESVTIFNENLQQPATGVLSPQLNLGISQNGIGFVLKF